MRELRRQRSYDDDVALVFRQDDEEGSLIRFRLEDFVMSKNDPIVYVCGSYLYSLDQLKGDADYWRSQFGATFTDVELIEGTNLQVVSLDEVVAFVSVLSSEKFASASAKGAEGLGTVCHHGSAFVDDDRVNKWKKVTTKARAPPPTGGEEEEDSRSKRKRQRRAS